MAKKPECPKCGHNKGVKEVLTEEWTLDAKGEKKEKISEKKSFRCVPCKKPVKAAAK